MDMDNRQNCCLIDWRFFAKDVYCMFDPFISLSFLSVENNFQSMGVDSHYVLLDEKILSSELLSLRSVNFLSLMIYRELVYYYLILYSLLKLYLMFFVLAVRYSCICIVYGPTYFCVCKHWRFHHFPCSITVLGPPILC